MRPVRAKALIINSFALAGRFAIFNPYTQGAALGYVLLGLSARFVDFLMRTMSSGFSTSASLKYLLLNFLVLTTTLLGCLKERAIQSRKDRMAKRRIDRINIKIHRIANLLYIIVDLLHILSRDVCLLECLS